MFPNSYVTASAIAWVYQRLKDHHNALAWSDRALQDNPSYARAHAQKAYSLAHLGEEKQGLEELLRASQSDPRYESQHYHLLALGSAHSRLGMIDESIAAYEKAHSLFPKDAEAAYWHGWALVAAKRPKEAETTLREAIHLDPSRADAHYNLGIALGNLEKWNEAVTEFAETLRLDPARADAHFGLGNAYKELRQFKNAVEPLREAIRMNPDDPDAYVQIGVAYSELALWRETLETGKKLRQLLPGNEIGYWWMSSALTELGQYEESVEVTEANLRLNPSSLPAIEGLGYTYLKSRRFADAIPVFKRAIELHADADYLYAQLGAAYLEIGDTVSASEQQNILRTMNSSYAEELEKEIQKKLAEANWPN